MTTETKLHTAKSQMIYWSRRVSELTKQMERERAAIKRDGSGGERKGLDREPAKR